VTWAVDSLDSARRQLGSSLWKRLDAQTRAEVDRVRFPVAFVWLRGNRAGRGKELSDQAIASYGYWNDTSQEFFDIVFPGWLAEGVNAERPYIAFDQGHFLRCVKDVESISKWRYRDGVSEVLLLHWDYDLGTFTGDFSFDEAVPLPVEELVAQGKVDSLDRFMSELIDHAKALSPPGPHGAVWDIANRMAFDRGRRSAWAWINKTFLRDAGTIVDELRPFQVCDLRV
jgi:hypothetical protein